MKQTGAIVVHRVQVPAGDVMLDGDLSLPEGASGIVLFAHGSGSSRHSPRNRYVADVLHRARLGTLLFDLLTPEEELADGRTAGIRFDIALLASRLLHAVDWMHLQEERLAVGLFGSSTGGAAALLAAGQRSGRVAAVVSRGGRPDLAGPGLRQVESPTLLIVGARDKDVLELNRLALADLSCEKQLEIVPRAGHLFEEPGALEKVARMAQEWFEFHLGSDLVRARGMAKISEGL
jgi:pimeloyl-ACP methyl ester carboxylesterase